MLVSSCCKPWLRTNRHVEDLARASLARLTRPTLQDFHGFDV